MNLKLTETTRNSVRIIGVKGDLVVYTVDTLRKHVISTIEDERISHLVFDLDKCDYLDATGLGVIVGALKRARVHEGGVAVVCTVPRIVKVFRITGLAGVLKLSESVDEALGRLKAEECYGTTVTTVCENTGPVHGPARPTDAERMKEALLWIGAECRRYVPGYGFTCRATDRKPVADYTDGEWCVGCIAAHGLGT
ncbi:MAG TPA: anti-sigma factor antagonist [Streptosporangiaceae bacterium]|nr:anti-sigma factor antagonist [Streptosporangiaceae bacterium]